MQITLTISVCNNIKLLPVINLVYTHAARHSTCSKQQKTHMELPRVTWLWTLPVLDWRETVLLREERELASWERSLSWGETHTHSCSRQTERHYYLWKIVFVNLKYHCTIQNKCQPFVKIIYMYAREINPLYSISGGMLYYRVANFEGVMAD